MCKGPNKIVQLVSVHKDKLSTISYSYMDLAHVVPQGSGIGYAAA